MFSTLADFTTSTSWYLALKKKTKNKTEQKDQSLNSIATLHNVSISSLFSNTSSKGNLISVGTRRVTLSTTIRPVLNQVTVHLRWSFSSLHINLKGLHVQISLLSGMKQCTGLQCWRSVWITEPALTSTDHHTANFVFVFLCDARRGALILPRSLTAYVQNATITTTRFHTMQQQMTNCWEWRSPEPRFHQTLPVYYLCNQTQTEELYLNSESVQRLL